MKNKKRWLRVLAFLLIAVMAMSGNALSAFAAMDTINITFDANNDNATVSMVDFDNSKWGYFRTTGQTFYKGTTIGASIKDIDIQSTNQNDVFDGWALFQKVVLLDASDNPQVDSYGLPLVDYQRVGNTLYQTADVLNYVVPNSGVATELMFKAQWNGQAVGDTVGNNPCAPVETINIMFNACSSTGQITLSHKNTFSNIVGSSVGEFFTTGEKVNSLLQDITITNTDSNLTFMGWILCEKAAVTDNAGNQVVDAYNRPIYDWMPLNNTLYQANDILNYDVTDSHSQLCFMAQWSGGSAPGTGGSASEINIFFQGNNPNAQVCIVNLDGTDRGFYQSVGEMFTINEQINKKISNLKVTNSDSAAVFEGWTLCELVPVMDENGIPVTDNDGNQIVSWESIDGVLYDTDDVIDYVVPSGYTELAFMAQWSGGSGGNNSQQPSGTRVEFELNDGTVNFFGNPTNYFGDFFESGKTIADGLSKDANYVGLNGTVADPVFWTTNRAFEGWIVCTLEEVDDGQGHSWFELVQIPNTGLLTTAQVLAYEVQQEQIVFVAQWAGNDSDYYTNVVFEGHGQDITVSEKMWDDTLGQEVFVDRQFQGFGSNFRQTGDSIKWQMENLDSMMFKAEPVKQGAVLEGWLEYQFAVGANGEEISRTPVSDKLYTTAEMLNSKVPVDNTVFVAKWSDIPLEQYAGFGGNSGTPIPDGTIDSWGNLYMFANGGNFDYIYYDEGTPVKEEGYGFFVYEIDHDKAFKQCMDTYGDGLTNVYYTNKTLKGWTLYTCDMIEVLYIEHGKDPAFGDPDLTMFLVAEDAEMDTYVLLTKAVKSNELVSTDVIYNLSGAKEYYVVAEWDDAPVNPPKDEPQDKPLGDDSKDESQDKPSEEHVKHTEADAVSENVKQPTATTKGSYDRVVYCKDCGKELSRKTIETTMVSQEVVIPSIQDGVSARVDIVSAVTEVPKGIVNKYDSVDDIQNEMVKKSLETNKNFNSDDMKVVLLDVELKVETSEGVWEVVTYDNFPEDGLYITLPYPDGIKAEDFNFVITHMISEGTRAGEVEVLAYTLESDGLRVKVMSLSPILIAYEEKTDEEKNNIPVVPPTEEPEDTPAEKPEDTPAEKPEDTPVEKPENTPQEKPTEIPSTGGSPETGDSASYLLYLMAFAFGLSIVICLNRKSKRS